MTTPPVTRFAPSPTGPLHLGHAFAALTAAAAARAGGGRFLLRIEDLDGARARPHYERAIRDDLTWLGLRWQEPVVRQSERGGAYAAALARLDAMHLLYPCFCTRQEIEAEIAASAAAPHGPDGPLYPGTCKPLSRDERAVRIAAGVPHALRLDVTEAMVRTGGGLTFTERGAGPAGEAGLIRARPEQFGDVIVARKDAAAAYHLACVVDDAAQAVTLVTRGDDLFAASHLHRLLQALLDLPVPDYAHHRLIRNAQGRRLAKRDDALSLAALRAEGATPTDVLRLLNEPALMAGETFG